MFFVRYQLLSLAWGVAIVHIYSGRLLLVFVAPVSKIFVLAQEKKAVDGQAQLGIVGFACPAAAAGAASAAMPVCVASFNISPLHDCHDRRTRNWMAE